jgi:hypothetical protein
LSIFIIIMVVFFLFSLFSPKRANKGRLNNASSGGLPPRGTAWAQKTCSSCGAPHPSYAAFCRHCGTRI